MKYQVPTSRTGSRPQRKIYCYVSIQASDCRKPGEGVAQDARYFAWRYPQGKTVYIAIVRADFLGRAARKVAQFLNWTIPGVGQWL